ncbi:OmpA family protein [Pseudoxanthomonas japonensis]|nr:OmpA family protein [Pseudoxanthomonas japonensis]
MMWPRRISFCALAGWLVLAATSSLAQTASNTVTVSPPTGVIDPVCEVGNPLCNSATDTDTVLYGVTLGKQWSGGVAGNAVALTIGGTGVVNATAGSSSAPGTTTHATAGVPGGTSITLTEAFSVGDVAGYVVTLSCNGASVPVTVDTSTQVATATFTTPATGAVVCEYTNTALSQTLTKALTSNADGDNSGTVSLGDVLTYTVTVTNTSTTGNLANVVVSDSKITPGSTTCASVAPGATCVLAGTYLVTAADVAAGSISNTATATSPVCPVGSADPACTRTVVTPAAPLSQTLAKALTHHADGDNSGTVSLGDVLTYTVTVTNIGTTGNLTNVVVSDSRITPGSATCASVAPAATCVLVGTYVVTAADVAAGNIRNTATVTSPVCAVGSTGPACSTTVDTPTAHRVIDAVDDAYTGISGAAGNTNVGNAYTGNDTLNNQPVNPTDIVGAVTTPATPINGGPVPVLDAATGVVSVPAGTPAGSYTIAYRICERVDPTNCDTATITVTVTAPAIDAVDDISPSINGSTGGTTPSVLTNDTLNGQPVDPSEVTLTPGAGPNPGLTMNPDGTITVAPGTPAGTYAYPYQICEVANPTNCDSANATVIVGAAPIVANDDTYTGINGATGNANAGNAYTNDTLNGQPITDVFAITGAVLTPATPINGGPVPVLDPTTGVVGVPAGTPAGSYTITYQICERLNATNCDPATITVTVVAPVINAVDDTSEPINTGAGGITPSVLINDTLNGSPVAPVAVTVVPGANPHPGLTMNPDGTVAVTPGTPPGTYPYPYTICERLNPANCDTAVATVTVIGQAQLRLVKTAGVREAKVGDLVRYTITAENVGDADLINGYLIDTAPVGFTYVEGSLSVVDGDNAGAVSGQHPIRFGGLDVRAGQTATLVYLMRVGAGVRPGTQVNQAQGYSPTNRPISNVVAAEVALVADPLVDNSLILGTVFDDRDGDGWQDSATMSGIRVRGGFSRSAYVPNSTTIDRGTGPQPEPDASSPMLHGIAVGTLGGRQSVADPEHAHQVVIRQTLRSPDFTDDFVLTNAQGVTVRMDKAGNTTVEKSGEAARGLNAAAPKVERKVAQDESGYVVDYTISNAGIDERGIPGVRIASVEGLVIETDQFGRYHLPDTFGGADRGRNFILKVDPSTLPAGAGFTTDNPLLRRLVPGLPVRFDFGVKLPVEEIPGGSEQIELEMGQVFFAPGSAEVRAEYLPAIDKMADMVERYHGGEVIIAANGETDALAFDRATAVKAALMGRLSVESAKALQVSVRTNVDDPDSLLVGVGDGGTLLGTVLFDTDKSLIRPEFEPLLDKVAAALEKMGSGQIGIVGHTDVRASREYNVALGQRRSSAVYEALAKRLSPEVRAKVRVEVSDDPTAAVGAKRK